MPVVINEFEVMPAEPAKSEQSTPRHEGAASPSKISEHDLEKMMERQHERSLRVRAD